MTPALPLVDRLDQALPQTQCTRCGYADCRDYAAAVASGAAGINQCPPGGAEGIARLAGMTGRPVQPLDPANGREGPRLLARIEEAGCIGCTLCLHACPVDCIVGAPKRMHTVIAPLCTGCELCVPVCPVDCIVIDAVTTGRTGWQGWSEADAARSRERYEAHRARLARLREEESRRLNSMATVPRDSEAEGPAAPVSRARAVEAALARARERRAAG